MARATSLLDDGRRVHSPYSSSRSYRRQIDTPIEADDRLVRKDLRHEKLIPGLHTITVRVRTGRRERSGDSLTALAELSRDGGGELGFEQPRIAPPSL